ncbi:hypothetical protein GLT90_02160 [Nanohaloarchaea archaeon H12]|nr:hypothetical protein [Nanohaloarchaea archaeon H12]
MTKQSKDLDTGIPEQLQKPEYNFVKLTGADAPEDEQKKPVDGFKQDYNHEPYNSENIKEWLNHGYNVGLYVQHKLLVLDFDTTEDYEALEPYLPDTFTVETQSRDGYHLYYKCYDDLTRQRSIKTPHGEIDTRIPGKGYIIVPPSEYENTYRVHKDLDIETISIDRIDKALDAAFDVDTKQNLDKDTVTSEPHSEKHSEPVEDNEITEVLDHISPDERPSYHKWFKVIAAVYDATHGDKDKAEAYLKNWRAEEETGEYRRRLNSLDGGHDNPTTWATAVHYAKQDSDYKPVYYDEYKGFRTDTDAERVGFTNNTVLYEHSTMQNGAGSVTWEKHWELHKIEKHIGNDPILVKADQDRRTSQKVYLQQYDGGGKYAGQILSQLDNEHLEKIAKARNNINVDTDEAERDEIIDAILRAHNEYPYIFYCATPIPKQSFAKWENHLALVKDVLSEGADQIDSDLLTAWAAQVPRLSTDETEPKFVQDSNAHTLMLTNSGTGKTSRARHIAGDTPSEQSTDAGLLGFADNDTRTYGKLHQRDKPTFIEELQEKKDNVINNLLGYQESGEVEIDKGCRVECTGVSSIVFQGNPKLDNDEGLDDATQREILMDELRNVLNTITTNTEAQSRRLGLTLFGKNFKTIEGAPPQPKVRQTITQILQSLADNFKDEFTRLVRNKQVHRWLHKEHSDHYINLIDELQSTGLPKEIEDFLEGQKINHTHARGVALRLAWLEHGLSYYLENDEHDVQGVLDCAKKHYDTVKQTNKRSFRRIVDVADSQIEELRRQKVDQVTTKYKKAVLHGVLGYADQSQDVNSYVALGELPLSDVVDAEDDLNERYQKPGYLKQQLDGKNFEVFEQFGFKYDDEREVIFVFAPSNLNRYCTFCTLRTPDSARTGEQTSVISKVNTDIGTSTESKESTESTESTQSTQNTPNYHNVIATVNDIDDGGGAPVEDVIRRFDEQHHDKAEQIIEELQLQNDEGQDRLLNHSGRLEVIQ